MGEGERGDYSTNGLRTEIIRRGGKSLTLSEVDGEEGAAAPGDDEAGELDDGEGEEFPGDPEVEEDAFEGVGVGLEDLPLVFCGATFAEVGIEGCGGVLVG